MRIDRRDPNWQAVEEFAAARLKQLREENDDDTLGERDTQLIRGQIAAFKAILALPDTDKPGPVIPSESYID